MTGPGERSHVGFWTQTRILMNKNWLSRKRNKKITTAEFSLMLSSLGMLAVLQFPNHNSNNPDNYPEQLISYEYPQDVLFSELSDTYARTATATATATSRSRSSNSDLNLNSNARLTSKLDPNLNLFLVPLQQYLLLLWGSFNKKNSDKKLPKNNTRQSISNSNTRATTLNFPTIHVVPNDQFTKTFTQDLMQSIWSGSGGSSATSVTPLSFEYYATKKELVHQYETNSRSKINIALILRGTVGKLFKYSIRINPGRKVPSPQVKTEGPETCRGRQSKDAGIERVKTCPANGYFHSKFLALQSLVEQAVVKLNEKERKDGITRRTRLSVTMENYPKKELETHADGIFPPVMSQLYLYLVPPSAFVAIVNGIVILIVSEKEKTLKDGLRMVGVSDGAYWFSWIAHYVICLVLPYSVLATGLLFLGTLRHLHLIITFLLFFTLGLSSVTFALALTPLFDTPKEAGVTGMNVFHVMVYLAAGLPFAVNPRDILMLPLKIMSPVAFVSGLDHAYRYEKAGGITLGDLVPGGKGDLILYALLFLMLDIILYGFIAFYLDNVLPNSFGVKQHPLFCFRPSFWRKPKSNSNITNGNEEGNDELPESENFEPVAENLRGKEVIRIRHISKTYSDTSCSSKTKQVRTPAVNDLSLNIYEGQITAILGRNGAGKSTLFNILSGLVSPSSGKAIVFGQDASRSGHQKKIREMTGVCLQSNICFPCLTVEEHLEFYGKLRGLKNKELNDEIGKTLWDLKLERSYDLTGDKLSGGQQRKLSVAVALIGDPKIILLDEPTAGFDPASRRYLWSLLQRKKEGKVILLTTHFMDEADILAERKAIVHDGILKCVGSSLFLKNHFGAGYYLTVEMKDRTKNGSSIADKIIKKIIPVAIEPGKVVGHEIKYSIPTDQASKLPLLFAELEAEIGREGDGGSSIKTYGVSMTTLEDVFLKVSNESTSFLVEKSESGNTINTEDTNRKEKEDRHNLVKDYSDLQRRSGKIFCSMFLMRLRRVVRSPGTILIPSVVMLAIFIPFTALVSRFDVSEADFLILSNPAGIYDKSALRVAVNEPPTSEFSKFLTDNNIIATSYSGRFEDLLSVNKGKGSMAAVTITSQTFSVTDHELVAEMRINGTFLHAPGIMLALISKYFNRMSQTNPTSGKELFTNLKYYPFSKHGVLVETNNSKSLDLTDFVFLFFILYLCQLLNVAFLGMVNEIIKDKELKVRNHLRVNGLSFTMYFTSIFLVYGIILFLIIVCTISVIWVLGLEYYYNVYALSVLFTLMLLYILPALITSAIFSYLLKTVESAQTLFSVLVVLGGLLSYGIINLLDFFFTKNPTPVRVVHIILSLLDVFYIPVGALYWTKKEYTTYKILNSGDVTGISFSTYNTPEILSMYITMLVQIPVLFILLLVTDVCKSGGSLTQALVSFVCLHKPKPGEVHNFQPDKQQQRLPTGEGPNPEDEVDDVAEEKSRVARYFGGKHPNQNNVVVAVKNVRKSYFPTHVLNGVNFMIEEGEVFGLLGHNGAGKTTLIRIITAEESPGSGKVHLCSYDITSNVSEAFLYLGFCPQHDALWENITLKEHLLLYATIRGIPKNKQDKLVAHFLEGLNIAEHVNKRASRLSGGTKRKLSYAMSMLGAPRIVLLDEPSTGMDPQSKRFLWNTVLATFKDSRGAMLTTHSMEEADVLCNRIAIMASGTILCIGTPQHLKNKFGTGYNIEIKLKQEPHDVDVGPSPPSAKANTTVIEVAENAPPEAPPRPGPGPGPGPAKGPVPVSVPVPVSANSLTRLPPAPAQVPAPVPLSAAGPPQQGVRQHDEVAASTEIEVPPQFQFVVERFPNSKLVELFENRAVFSVLKAQNFSLSEIFTTLENWKATGNVEEYSFSQTTLEEIFLMFNNDDKKIQEPQKK